MNRKTIFFALVSFLILASCKSHYEVASVQRSRILVDARYDATPDAEAAKFLEPYKHVVDSVMGPIVGRSARNMTTQRPEGTLPTCLPTFWYGQVKTTRRNQILAFIIWEVSGLTCLRAM